MGNPSYGGACLCAMLVLALFVGGKEAVQAASAVAPAPATDCNAVIFTMTDCLGYVTGTDKKPPTACCTELSSVVANTPQCLCQLFNASLTGPLGVNITVAQQLPVACKVQTPDPSLCSAFGIPVAGPVAMTPATSPASSTSKAPGPAAPGPATASSSPGMAASPAGSTAAPGTSTATNTTVAPGPSSAPAALLHGVVPAIAMIIAYLIVS